MHGLSLEAGDQKQDQPEETSLNYIPFVGFSRQPALITPNFRLIDPQLQTAPPANLQKVGLNRRAAIDNIKIITWLCKVKL